MATTQTFTEFLNRAATEIGALTPGGSLSGNQLDLWRSSFNTIVKNMSADRLFLFYVPDSTYILATSKEDFEIGPGAADFDTDPGVYVRPVFVESARARVGNGRRWPLNVRTEQEWASNPLRGVTDPDGPLDMTYSASIKKGVFRFAAKPVAGQTVYISQWNPLKTFDITEMAAVMEDYYPDEYILALKLLLSIDRGPSYNRQPSQDLMANAGRAVQTIKELNNTRLGGSAGQSSTLQAPAIGIGNKMMPQQGQ